jgi:hypothetical protein
MKKLLLVLLFVIACSPAQSDDECVSQACERGYENACVTRQEAAELRKACETRPCGACAGEPNECYEKYGQCEKNLIGCGWKQSLELQNCLEKQKANKNTDIDNVIEDALKGTGYKLVPLEKMSEKNFKPN